jgi:hypothetical protein
MTITILVVRPTLSQSHKSLNYVIPIHYEENIPLNKCD